MKKLALGLAFALSMMSVSQAAYYNLGTNAPPASVGGCTFIPFDLGAQEAISEGTLVSTIPGAPAGYTLTTSYNVRRRTVPYSWGGLVPRLYWSSVLYWQWTNYTYPEHSAGGLWFHAVYGHWYIWYC